jgi:hypothetical protein
MRLRFEMELCMGMEGKNEGQQIARILVALSRIMIGAAAGLVHFPY